MRAFRRRPGHITAVILSTLALGIPGSPARAADPSGARGRCPGGFTEGACPADRAWPGGSSVTVADAADVFGLNLSGLSFEAPGVLWAVDNSPSRLYRLVPDGPLWSPDPADGWASGKPLHYADGGGDPDTEAVVSTPEGLFMATERDNDDRGTSRPQILRYDPSGSASSLSATAEWDLTSDLPPVAPNSGLEAISWIPDTFLTAHGFQDDRTGTAYAPAAYPGHGGGLFLVGLEANGTIYAYALAPGGTSTRVAAFPSGFPTVMDLEFDPATGHLWAVCDDTCNGRSTTLDINPKGHFSITHTYDRPAAMPDYNNEGFAISPTCTAGRKQTLWSDDSNTGAHALHAGTLTCPDQPETTR